MRGLEEKINETMGNKARKRKRPSENWLDQRLKSEGLQHQTSISGPESPPQRQWAWKRRGRNRGKLNKCVGITRCLQGKHCHNEIHNASDKEILKCVTQGGQMASLSCFAQTHDHSRIIHTYR